MCKKSREIVEYAKMREQSWQQQKYWKKASVHNKTKVGKWKKKTNLYETDKPAKIKFRIKWTVNILMTNINK